MKRAGPMGAGPGWVEVFSPFTHTGGWVFATLVEVLGKQFGGNERLVEFAVASGVSSFKMDFTG